MRTQLIGTQVGSVDMYAWLTMVRALLQGQPRGDELIISDLGGQVARVQALYNAILSVGNGDKTATQVFSFVMDEAVDSAEVF